jgi:hypothetical protein
MNAASAEPHPTGLAGTDPVCAGGSAEAGTARQRPVDARPVVDAYRAGFRRACPVAFRIRRAKTIVPRAVTNVPALKLADDSSEWLALNDPTLFALPHQKDFASAIWLQTAASTQPSFRWTEPPRWLPLSADDLGLALINSCRPIVSRALNCN